MLKKLLCLEIFYTFCFNFFHLKIKLRTLRFAFPDFTFNIRILCLEVKSNITKIEHFFIIKSLWVTANLDFEMQTIFISELN